MTSTPSIDAAVERSGLLRDAIETARLAHAGQLRRGSDGHPYIEHPVAVAELLATCKYDDEILAAALLHDVVEKSEVAMAQLRERFGDGVAEMVEALTEDETIEDYTERKREQRRRVSKSGTDAMAIFAADKLTNVAMLREAYALIGENVSEELAVSLDLKIFVWEEDLEMLFDELPSKVLPNQLADEMVSLWADRFRAVRDRSD
jgi:(p)ppGpp synthase/HD superfamily hydrolase